MDNSIDMAFKASWAKVEWVREKTTKFLETHGFSQVTVYSMAMIISELVENSIKYGHFCTPEDEIFVRLNISRNLLTMEVHNPVDDSATIHLKRLDRTIQWIRGYQDSFEAYIEKLKEISKKPLEDEESGLGLVRIAYEGKAILDFYVGDNDMLNVSAVANVD
ncbi:MAG: ATP-binding protein [Calditrichales bacterium]|nr:MAG: ATP-binding protein [Calditrichales bacterium]